MPIFIIVYYRTGGTTTIMCSSEGEAGRVLYHNLYYHRFCLKVRVKRIKEEVTS